MAHVLQVRKHVLIGWVTVPAALWRGYVPEFRACVPGVRIDFFRLAGGVVETSGEVVPSAAPAGSGAEGVAT